jgi:hypothetical protein
VMAEHDEGEEEAVGEGGNEKEVDGGDVASMGGEKGTPRGRRVSRRPVHVLGDGQLGDLVAEPGEFCLDTPPAPGRILPRHALDEVGRISASSRGRPGRVAVERQRQYSWKPWRCQARTVAGWTMTRLERQLVHRRDSQTQRIRSQRDRRGRRSDR